ncbi:MAG: magnesium transporter MgtE N-terminal domain-containing protein, partial [Ilumatobacteraceae bacterium]
MAGDLIYAFRIMRLPLLDAGGASIGRVDDVVVVPGRSGSAPRVVGFTASSQRRRIFVNAGKVGEISDVGVRLRSWDIDLNPFKLKKGERLLGRDVIDRRVNGETVSDVALRERLDSKSGGWEVAQVRLAKRNALRRRPTHRLVEWVEVAALFAATTEMAAEAARLHDMHPTDVAAVVRSLPLSQRRQLAEAMDDDRLADVLEELPEAEQVGLIQGLDMDRLLAVLDEMEVDDLADLLAEMPGDQRAKILDAMDDEDADMMRRLLAYEEGTAGGLMTPEIIVLGPTSTVAEALAHLRDPEWLVSIAAQVFVCRPPYKAPTGKYLGVVHFQRLLREAPSLELGQCLETEPTVTPDISDREVAERLASYNMLSIGVCDEAGRLLGAITIDDVLDR